MNKMMNPEEILEGIGCKGKFNVNKKKAIQAIQIALNLSKLENRKMEKKIFYQDLIDLGFTRFDENDSVFLNQNGYNYFRVEYALNKKLYMEWDSETHDLTLVRWRDKDGGILNTMKIENIEAAKILIQFFTTENFVTENKSEPFINYNSTK